MPGLTLARSVEILREHRERTSKRHVDLALSLRVCDVDASGPEPLWLTDTDEELGEFGGRWDRRRKVWVGEADAVNIVRVPRGSDQEQAARWVAEWFKRYGAGRKGSHWSAPATIAGREEAQRWGRTVPGRISVEFRRVWTLMLVGGRRGGKSHLAVVALLLMMVLTPRTIVWAISPTQEETQELEDAARLMLPLDWYTERLAGAGKSLQFKLANGSKLLFLSGYKPRGLKRGRVDLAVLNEAQHMHRATWRHLRGAIADRGGLVILPCNPPDEAIGKWIDETWSLIQANRIDATAFHFVAKANPFVTEEALESMRKEVDDITAAREVDGKLGIPIGDTVFHAWSPDSIREVPAGFVDVTAEVARKHLGRAAGYIVGMDFQRQPHEAAVVLKFFEDPAEPGVPIPWIVDGVLVEDANEDELLDALERLPRWRPGDGAPDTRTHTECYRGWVEPTDDKAAPVHCAVVMDASAWWQDSEHNLGKKSNLLLAARRWTFLYKPQEDSDRNPLVAERVKVTNARLKEADQDGPTGRVPGRRRMFSCPHNLEINTAMAQWENVKTTGQPSRKSQHAHACDGVSYPVYRVFGKPRPRKGGQGYQSVGKRSRAAELAGM